MRRATPPPMRASTSRSLSGAGLCTAITMAAEAPPWMRPMMLETNALVSSMATPIVRATSSGFVPRKKTPAKPTTMPTVTPTSIPIARWPRSPTFTASAATAAIGAKVGCEWPSTVWARNQATPAAPAPCAIGHVSPHARATPATRWSQTPRKRLFTFATSSAYAMPVGAAKRRPRRCRTPCAHGWSARARIWRLISGRPMARFAEGWEI